MDLGKRLKQLRGKRSRSDIAAKLAISSSALGMYECNRRIPSDAVKVRLAEFYGKTVQELFFDDGYPSSHRKEVQQVAANKQEAMTDGAVEAEISRLQNSPYVKLARKETRIRNRRRQYMYSLRLYEKKGRQLAAEGVTLESLDSLDADADLEKLNDEEGR